MKNTYQSDGRFRGLFLYSLGGWLPLLFEDSAFHFSFLFTASTIDYGTK